MALKTPNLTTGCTAIVQIPIKEFKRDWGIEVTQFELGEVSSVRNRSGKLRAWRLPYRNQTDTEYLSFVAFYDARFGAFETFYWDNPTTGEDDIPVMFDPDEDLDVEFDHRLRHWDVTLLEIKE